MVKVKSVKKQRNKLYSVLLQTDKKLEKYEVSEDLIVEFRLLKDKELSKKEYKEFKIANDRDLVYQKVLHYALYKMRCEKEIVDYLNKNKIPFSEEKYYLNKLKKAKIIDDLRYSEIFVRESFNFKRLGPNKIIHELDLKKINRDYYLKYIQEIKQNELNDNLDYWFNKKLNSLKNKSRKAATQVIKQFIINKGYSFEVVNSFINKRINDIDKAIDETDILKQDYEKALKKNKDKPNSKKAIIASLLRKGYDYSKIKAVMGED